VNKLPLLASLFLGGCSVIGMRGPSPLDPAGTYPLCSDRAGPWVLDALAGTAAALVTSTSVENDEPEIAVAAGVAAAGWVGSAIYGIVTHARCGSSRGSFAAPAPAYQLDANEPPVVPFAPTPPAQLHPVAEPRAP